MSLGLQQKGGHKDKPTDAERSWEGRAADTKFWFLYSLFVQIMCSCQGLDF